MQLTCFRKRAAAAWRAPVLLFIVAALAARAAGAGPQPLPSLTERLNQNRAEVLPPAEDVEEDSWFPQGVGSWPSTRPTPGAGLPWVWQLLPDGLVWRSYLAGVKEPRFRW